MTISNKENTNSLQEIFNKAWQHFIVEDGLPASEYNQAIDMYSCKYLTDKGRKCAVGLSIPEGHSAQYYNGNFSEIIILYPDLFSDLVNFDEEIIDNFQYYLHDNLTDISNGQWRFTKKQRKNKYLAVAREYGLTIPERSS